MTPVQCRMARAALGWSIRRLAQEAELASNTVLAFERGRPVLASTEQIIRQTLAQHGIEFSTSESLGTGFVAVHHKTGMV